MNKIKKIIYSLCWLWLFFAFISFGVSIDNFESKNIFTFATTLTVSIICMVIGMKLLNRTNHEKIKIIYHADIDKIKRINKGDWIDLRSAEDVILKKGEFKLISLGVSMKLPEGYEAHIVPRSSTYKNFKIIQTNHQAVIDNSFSGSNDIWKYPVLAIEDTVIHKNDRICQFRIVRTQPEVHFIETDKLDGVDRGGFGSTGKQ